jgi:hypothetical protein
VTEPVSSGSSVLTSSLLTEAPTGNVEAAEEVGLLDRNPGFTDTASATESVGAADAADMALDDITEDLGGVPSAALESGAPVVEEYPAPSAFEETRRPRGRAWAYAGAAALAAALVAAVVLWPQWGPWVMNGALGTSALAASKTPAKAVAVVAVPKSEKPATAPPASLSAVTPAPEKAAAVAPVATAAPNAATAVEASYRSSWDTVIALSLGTHTPTGASGKAGTR